MIIRELLEEKNSVGVKVIAPESSLIEAARELVSYNIGAIVVTDAAGRLAGILSERDLTRSIAANDGNVTTLKVADMMTRSVVTCTPDDGVVEVLNLMNANRIRHVPVVVDAKLSGIVSIRELTRAYELVEAQANTDSLTGVSTRRHFLEALTKEFDRHRRYGRPISVAMIDIDHFKQVNDTYGHAAGDDVLRTIADLMARELRTLDIVGRLGGEEFAAVFPETDLPGAAIACRRVLDTIRAERVDIGGQTISVTASVGVTRFNADMPNAQSALKRADELLYVAKSRGRDRVEVDTLEERTSEPRDMLANA